MVGMLSKGYSSWFVCFYTTILEPAQCNKDLKIKFAEMSVFENDKLVLSWATFCGLTHKLAVNE